MGLTLLLQLIPFLAVIFAAEGASVAHYIGLKNVKITYDFKQYNEIMKPLSANSEKIAKQPFSSRDDMKSSIEEKIMHSVPKKAQDYAGSISHHVIKESAQYGLDPVFVMAVIQTESSFNPEAKGPFGEIGLMQLRPETAKWIAKKYDILYTGIESLKLPRINIKIGTAYLDYLRKHFNKSPIQYISAYNMGVKNVKKLISNKKVPRVYQQKVIGNYKKMYDSFGKKTPLTATIKTKSAKTKKIKVAKNEKNTNLVSN